MNHYRDSRSMRILAGFFSLAIVTFAVGVSQLRQTASVPLLLRLDIRDDSTGKFTAARFSLDVDGKTFFPEKLGKHGLRFVSVHKSRGQIYPVTYVRGTGAVEMTLPENAKRVTVHVAKGFEYFPASVTQQITGKKVAIRVRLKRWIDLRANGWVAADAHVHYDRLKPTGDKKWLTMLAADDLHAACFMVLKGGQVPGIWARQYAYGKNGEAFDGERLLCPGMEYRDGAQGHINLFRIAKIIEPISTGGIGKPTVRFNYPPLYEVFGNSRKLGGFAGVAHGGSLGREPTAVLDTVLGKVDFFEIANAHLYSVDLWYRLLNAGYDVPPTAGTDLPNYPYRDAWQPFLGSMRMYVQMGEMRDFASWRKAIEQGRVIVTSGPSLSLKVDNAGPGGVIQLPKSGGHVTIDAELATPIGLRKMELIQNGKPLEVMISKREAGGVHRWRMRTKVRIDNSCWLAARGEGVELKSLQLLKSRKQPWLQTATVAHTAPIRVIVGNQPVRSPEAVKSLVKRLLRQQEFYRTKGVFAKGADRLRMLELFDAAIAKLRKRR